MYIYLGLAIHMVLPYSILTYFKQLLKKDP